MQNSDSLTDHQILSDSIKFYQILLNSIKFHQILSDEERIFKGTAPDQMWEQFAVVAADLLERIQSSMSYNNTPYASSGDEDDNELGKNDLQNANLTNGTLKKWLAEP